MQSDQTTERDADGGAGDGDATGSAAPAVVDLRSKLEEGGAEPADCLDELEEVAGRPDRRRSMDENVWLYRMLARARRASEGEQPASEALRRAQQIDPTDEATAEECAAILSDSVDGLDPEDERTVVERSLAMAPADAASGPRADLAQRLGRLAGERGDEQRAVSARIEAARVAEDEERSATLIRRAVTGDEGRALDFDEKRRAVDSLESSDLRADLLVELAASCREQAPERALDVLTEARRQVPGDPEVAGRAVDVARQLEDWEAVYEAAVAAARASEGDERVEWLIEASDVARRELWRPERALSGYRGALELDPSRRDAFEAVTALLVDARDWDRLERAYLDLIELNREAGDEEVLGVLWKKLGDLYHQQFDAPSDELDAYEAALSHSPATPDLHRRAAEAARTIEAADAEARHREALWRAEPQRLEELVRLGRLRAEEGEDDAARRTLQIAEWVGADLSPADRERIERHETAMYDSPERPLTDGTFLGRVRPAELDGDIDTVFRTIYPVVRRWVEEDPTAYDLSRGDRVDLDEPLAFNNIYTDVAESLGWETPPDVWRREGVSGVGKLALGTGALGVGDELFGSGREKEIAFAVGRALFLLAKPYYLPGLRSMVDLEAFFVLAFDFSHPEIDLDRDREMERAYEMMEEEITGQARDDLAAAVQGATDDRGEVDLATWIEAVDDAANRTGLLFAGDPEAAQRRLEAEPDSFSQRTLEARLEALAAFGVGETFAELRRDFGFARERG